MFARLCRLNIKEVFRIPKNLLSSKMNLANSASERNIPLAGISQMRATNDKAGNLRQVSSIVEMARKESVDFLFIPECCDFVGENRRETIDLAEPLSGPTVEAYRKLAKDNRIWISFGGLHEAILNSNGEKTEKIYNTHLVVNSNGSIVKSYRKLHLFDVDTTQFRFRESEVVSKGREIVSPIDSPIGKVGLQICYDIRFPEVSTILRKYGAEILTYPSAFAYSTGTAHWEILLRARAIENQCFVIAPAQVGFHNKKRQSYGHAMIIDPWGKILAECKNSDLEVAVAKIDLDLLNEVRCSMPSFEHRRSDVYSLIPNNISDHLDLLGDMNFGGYPISADTIFFTSKYSFAFTNIRCVVPGHVLISSKRPAKRLKDLTGEEAADLFETSLTVQKLLEEFYQATSSTVTVQDGEDAGQTVKHVHIHVMPRQKGDFTFNDQIYIELNKHDHGPETIRRPISEMVNEACSYREYIKQKLGQH